MFKSFITTLFSHPFKSKVTGDPESREYQLKLRKRGLLYIGHGLYFLLLLTIIDLLMTNVFVSGVMNYIFIGLFIVCVFFSLKFFSGMSYFIKSFFTSEINKFNKREELLQKITRKMNFRGLK